MAALSLWPFMRHTFGVHAFGAPALMAFTLIVVYGAAAESPAMLTFLWVWLTLVAFHRLRALRRERIGCPIVHSRFSGRPLAMLLPFFRDEERARQLEPLLCLFAAGPLMALDQGLGGFVLLGSLSISAATGFAMQAQRERVRRLHYAFLESRHLASQFCNDP